MNETYQEQIEEMNGDIQKLTEISQGLQQQHTNDEQEITALR